MKLTLDFYFSTIGSWFSENHEEKFIKYWHRFCEHSDSFWETELLFGCNMESGCLGIVLWASSWLCGKVGQVCVRPKGGVLRLEDVDLNLPSSGILWGVVGESQMVLCFIKELWLKPSYQESLRAFSILFGLFPSNKESMNPLRETNLFRNILLSKLLCHQDFS